VSESAELHVDVASPSQGERAIFSQYWYVDDETDSFIEIKNHRSTPLVVVPRLSLSGPQSIEITPVSLRPFESKRIGLRTHLSSYLEIIAEEQDAHFVGRWGNGCRSASMVGNARLVPIYPDNVDLEHFSAWIVVENAVEGISLVYPFKRPSSQAGTSLQGIWWRPYPTVSIFYALQNASTNNLAVQARIFNHNGEQIEASNIRLEPFGFHLFDVTTALPDDSAEVGGVEFSYDADTEYIQAGSLLGRGMVIEERHGFSASLEAHSSVTGSPRQDNGSVMHVPTLLFGDLGGIWPRLNSLLQPDKVVIRPHLLLRNVSEHRLQIDGRVTGKDVSGRLHEIVVPTRDLKPHQTTHIDLKRLIDAGSRVIGNVVASLELRHGGASGDVVAELINVDETGDFCLYERVVDLNGYRAQALAAISFKVRDDAQTFLVIKNVLEKPEQVRILIDYDQGAESYEQCFELGGGEITVIDLAELRDSHVPDVMMRTLPADVTFGGCLISTRTPGALVAGDPTFKFGSMPDGFSCLAEAPTGGPSGTDATDLSCTLQAKRDDQSARFKVEGTTRPNATVELHRLEGGCDPTNAHPISFLTGRAKASGKFVLGPVTTVGTPIPGVGRRVLANVSSRGEEAHCCATVVEADL